MVPRTVRRLVALALLTLGLAAAPLADAAPYRGDSRRFAQPDGQEVEVRLFGTEVYLRAESPDGYTLAHDRASGWICYAEPAPDGGLRSSGIRYVGTADGATLGRLARRGVVPGLRASSAKVAEAVATNRGALARAPDADRGFHSSLYTVAEARYNPTLGSGKGLVVLVDFSDRVGSIPTSEYDNAFNGDTYDSLGSIRSWIEAISYGKYTASHTVLGYMRAAYPTSHYTGGAEFDYSASRELMKQVYKYIDDNLDLTDLATNGIMPSLVVIYPGAEIAKVWATGLWPHSGEGGYTTSEGVRIPNAFISNSGTRALDLKTFRHELGHSLFNWPDTYDYDDDSASGGGFATETTLPCAPFRAWSGWMNVIDVVGVNQSYSLAANGDTCLRYKNAANASEFFIVEYMRKETPRRPDTPDEGLLIWHVDERGDNSLQDMTPTRHYALSVEQADGLFELEKDGTKRAGDLFHAGYKDRFDDTTTPNSKWWNGSASGFTVCNIGNLDSSMSVTVGCSGPTDGGAGGTGGSGGAGGTTGAGGGTGTGGGTGSGGTGGGRDASVDAGRDASRRDGGMEVSPPSTGGSSARGGSTGTSGSMGSGGTTGSGGDTSGGGDTGGRGGSGGSSSAGSGGTGSGGAGGKTGTGGATGGGTGNGGSAAGTGGGAAGGSTGGSGGSASHGAGGSSGRSTAPGSAASTSGCGCDVGARRKGRAPDTAGLLFLALLAAGALLRRARHVG